MEKCGKKLCDCSPKEGQTDIRQTCDCEKILPRHFHIRDLLEQVAAVYDKKAE